MKKSPLISIITVTKDDPNGLLETSRSINRQFHNFMIEYLVLDGSSRDIQDKNLNMIKNIIKNDYIMTNHINMISKKIYGIYESMNFGLKIFKGSSIIFMNGGDTFYDKKSISYLIQEHLRNKFVSTVSFGQAEINSSIGLKWNFPGKNLQNFKNWLKFFEPNHQAMLVSADIALNKKYIEKCTISADKLWKREVLTASKKIFFINRPVCKFYLEGFSSKRPNLRILNSQLKDKYISNFRKIIIFIKFLIPPSFYKYYPLIQLLKSKIVDIIF